MASSGRFLLILCSLLLLGLGVLPVQAFSSDELSVAEMAREIGQSLKRNLDSEFIRRYLSPRDCNSSNLKGLVMERCAYRTVRDSLYLEKGEYLLRSVRFQVGAEEGGEFDMVLVGRHPRTKKHHFRVYEVKGGSVHVAREEARLQWKRVRTFIDDERSFQWESNPEEVLPRNFKEEPSYRLVTCKSETEPGDREIQIPYTRKQIEQMTALVYQTLSREVVDRQLKSGLLNPR